MSKSWESYTYDELSEILNTNIDNIMAYEYETEERSIKSYMKWMAAGKREAQKVFGNIVFKTDREILYG